jgi:tetratricopeptide (TPR) repeat protein
VYFNLAVCLFEDVEYEEAIKYFKKDLEVNPNNIETLSYL